MDFNLSSICDMLGDRIEEYNNTSKKRRIERGSCAPKAKIAKMFYENNTDSSMKHHDIVGTRMYASTPIQTPQTKSQQLSTLARFSSINKLQSELARSQLYENTKIEAKKLTFDEECSVVVDEKSDKEDSRVSFPSVTKVSLETLRRRRLQLRVQRTKVNVRRLSFDEHSEKNHECKEETISNACSFKDTTSNEEKTVISGDSANETLTQVLTPLYTPLRQRLPRKSMKAKRLTFEEVENEDATKDVYYSFSNELWSEKCSQQIMSPLKTLRRSFSEQSMSNGYVDTTLNEEAAYSSIMVLNVGIIIRPILDVGKQ